MNQSLKYTKHNSFLGRLNGKDCNFIDLEYYSDKFKDDYVVIRTEEADKSGMYDLVYQGYVVGTVLNNCHVVWGSDKNPKVPFERKYPRKKEEAEEKKLVIEEEKERDLLTSLLEETDRMFSQILSEVDSIKIE